MAFPIIGVLGALSGIIEKIIPDPAAAAEVKLRLAELAAKGEGDVLAANLQIPLAQVGLNTAEAQGNWFQKGWRPFVGWTCGAAFAYNFVVLPLLVFTATVLFGVEPKLMPPSLDLATMLPVLFGMLGLGGMRSFERSQGKA